MPKSRALQWTVTGLILAILMALGVVAVAMPRPLMSLAGLEIEGGAPTVDPSVFVEPTVPPEPEVEPNLAPPAAPVSGGKAPAAETLEGKLAALDTSEVLTPDGAPATLAYQIIDVASGDVLASKNADQPLIPASNTKTLTVAALLNAFDGNERFATKVHSVDDSTIVLAGAGDPLLASEPVEVGTYPRPASLRELATATAEALKAKGRTTVKLGFDASWFEGNGWNDTWPSGYRNQVTEISALWADEGRVDGARSRTPALAAATTFARQLGELGVTVEGDPTAMSASGAELAQVESLPVHVLAEQAMLRSNNSFTEVLGFQLAKKTGHPTTFAGSVAAIREQLTAMNLWREGAVLHDASGLSRSNLFSARMLADVNLHLMKEPRLSVILDGLPVAGVTGTLRERFGDAVAAPARGVARAKTGTLSFVSSLAGTTTTADGAVVAFAVMANGQESGWHSKLWEDRVVGVVTGCGC